MSERVADMFDLAVGDTLEIVRIHAPASGTTYGIGPKEARVATRISGISEPVNRHWSGCLDSHAAVKPFEDRAFGGVVFHGAVLADPAVIGDLSVVAHTDLFAQWVLRPEPVASLSVDARSIVEAIRRLEALGDGWNTPMDDDLVAHVEQRDSAGRVIRGVSNGLCKKGSVILE